ncbi:MAG TPA: SDR family oxidoreductase [Candidatus Dormibacteraeota bacterium]
MESDNGSHAQGLSQREPRPRGPRVLLTDPLEGRSCLVTGATGGIGLEIARGLARRGAHVIIHGRTRSRAEAAATWVRTQVKGVRLEAVAADLSSLDAVREMAAEVQRRHHELDVLVNNAGVLMTRLELTREGYEMTFAVNHLAPFLLTNLLLEYLQRTGAGRVVTVASVAHRTGVIEFGNLKGEKGFSSFAFYCNSKLANIMFTMELARRTDGTGVTANCFHPGAINTGLYRRSRIAALAFTVFGPFFPTAARGADTAIYLAGAPGVADINGAYFARRRMRRPSAQAFDAEVQQRLWQVSAEATGVGLP